VEAQRQAKQAKMAVRRFVRQRMRLSETEVAEKLAHSNAAVFSKVAASLIGGSTEGDHAELSGNEMQAGVLCFDEVNINDPFTAIALKGEPCMVVIRIPPVLRAALSYFPFLYYSRQSQHAEGGGSRCLLSR